MKKGYILMSEKESRRMLVFDRMQQGQFGLKEAAEQLMLSRKQARRSYRRYQAEGAAGLIHKSRGRASNRAKDASLKQAVLDRYRSLYRKVDLGPTQASEKLAADGFVVDHETLRRWLLEAGLWSRQRKRRKHRSWREPKAHFGELVQMDGSHHHWFGPDGKQSCLIGLIDDATKERLSYMAEGETVAACMTALLLWIGKYGIPRALYTDYKNIFVTDREPTPEEQLSGTVPRTHFGLACYKLGIEIVTASSPQAKGRIERKHGVDQNRLVKELALLDIKTIDGANAFLRGGYDDDLNDKFGVEPAAEEDFHRPVPKGLDLEEVFCIEEKRTLQNDWTIQWNNRVFQILKKNKPLPRPGQKIVVRQHLDGKISLWNNEQRLKAVELQRRDDTIRNRKWSATTCNRIGI